MFTHARFGIVSVSDSFHIPGHSLIERWLTQKRYDPSLGKNQMIKDAQNEERLRLPNTAYPQGWTPAWETDLYDALDKVLLSVLPFIG